ncbi:MAG: PASTA domain-containing protein [Clostridia bacterium]|nr:PASTA domain-containing protein [Clostridia bacterium]
MAHPAQHSGMHKRTIAFVVVLVLIWVYLISQLVRLQIADYDYYQQIVLNQLTVENTTTPDRGKIYDTNMNLLATNTTVYRVFIAPQDIMEFENESEDYGTGEAAAKIAEELVAVLGVDYNTVIEKSQKYNRRDETIKKNVDPDTAAILRAFIQENGFTGLLNLSAESKRYYCYGDLACHVLGFTNSDGNGVYGVEATYNDYLKGTSGKYITARNALQEDMPFKYESYVGAENGANLVTTIDMRLQYELENQLQAAYDSAQADERVCGIVMDVNTGGILAMAVVPGFDCNSPYELAEEYLTELAESGYAEDSDEYAKLRSSLMYQMWNNKCITETYEPGSTFKIITASIALEEDAVQVDDEFYCPGYHYVEGWGDIKCHKTAGHGKVTFARGLQQSCNPTMMETIERIGRETFYKYFEAFGYTSRTGIDLPGETSGVYHAMKNMNAVELATYSFGQTFKTTPLQQLTAICTVANGGYLVTPHVLKEMVDDDGNVISTYQDEDKLQILSEETCDTLLGILAEGVATDGGARNAYVKGYSVAAKTGTSQKRDKYVYYDAEGNVVSADDEWVSYEQPFRIGSCVGIAPAEDPQIAVLIMVDEPTVGGSYGSIVAAPYISKFLSAALPYLGVEPHYTEEELSKMDVAITDLTGMSTDDATLYITNRKLQWQIIGNGTKVLAQSPAGGSRLSTENGVVYLYVGDELPETDTVTVPDVMGKTATACNKAIVNAKLNIKVEGSVNVDGGSGALVISQSPAAGTEVPRGTVVTVEFRHTDMTD